MIIDDGNLSSGERMYRAYKILEEFCNTADGVTVRRYESSVSLVGEVIPFADAKPFADAVALSDMVDIYPCLDGTVQINMFFHDKAK